MAKNTRSIGQAMGIATASAIHKGSCGSDVNTSMMRWITMSGTPPK